MTIYSHNTTAVIKLKLTNKAYVSLSVSLHNVIYVNCGADELQCVWLTYMQQLRDVTIKADKLTLSLRSTIMSKLTLG